MPRVILHFHRVFFSNFRRAQQKYLSTLDYYRASTNCITTGFLALYPYSAKLYIENIYKQNTKKDNNQKNNV